MGLILYQINTLLAISEEELWWQIKAIVINAAMTSDQWKLFSNVIDGIFLQGHNIAVVKQNISVLLNILMAKIHNSFFLAVFQLS